MANDNPVIFVVEDDNSERAGLARLLQIRGYRVTAVASAEELLDRDINTQIGCIVSDVKLPGMSGLELHKRLSQRGILLPIIFISGHGDIPMAVRALKSGAVGFLTKPFGERELMTEIESALAVYQNQFQERSELAAIQERFNTLTARESQILDFVTSGKLNKQTASDLGIVENTVKVHRRRVMKKMRANSVADLVVMAHKLRLFREHTPAAGTDPNKPGAAGERGASNPPPSSNTPAYQGGSVTPRCNG